MGKKNQEGVPTGVRTREERRLCDASCGKGVLTADQNGTLTPTHTQPVRPVFARTRKGGSVGYATVQTAPAEAPTANKARRHAREARPCHPAKNAPPRRASRSRRAGRTRGARPRPVVFSK